MKLDANECEKVNVAVSELQDAISCADITELRHINNILDDLKSMIEDHMMALAGHGGDY